MTDTLPDTASARRGPAPAGSHSLLTFMPIVDCAKAIDFYVDTLGAKVVTRIDGPGGTVMHAEARLGDSIFHLSDPMPEYGIIGQPAEGNCFTMTYWTADVNAVYARMVAAGATVLTPLQDAFSGDRMGVLRCPFGVRWCIARHDRDVSPEEIKAAALEWMANDEASGGS